LSENCLEQIHKTFCSRARLYRQREEERFVTGYDFGRAEHDCKTRGFSPGEHLLQPFAFSSLA
jgi:hypothetical protein